MRFISGLKNLSKKTILLIIVILFIISWFLFIIVFVVNKDIVLSIYIAIFLGILAGFTFVLLIISFIIPIEKMSIIVILIAAVLTLPILWAFNWFIDVFYVFCFFANIVITAFFAFKFCMDTSTTVDDYLYKKQRSRIYTRIIEFVLFLFLSWWFLSLIIRFYRGFPAPGAEYFARIFVNLFWVGLILIIFVLLRLLFTRKLAAYISLFNIFTFVYVLYLVIGLWLEFILFDSSGYDIFSFIIDLLLFIYIIGSIFDRVDYIKEKLKIFRVGTIALFIILMKLLVQILRIRQEFILFMTIPQLIAQIVLEVQVMWIFFITFTILVGIYTIFKHKERESS